MTTPFKLTSRGKTGWAGAQTLTRTLTLALTLALMLAMPTPADALDLRTTNPDVQLTHGHRHRHGGYGPSITFGFGFYAPPPVRVYPVPVYPVPAYPPPVYYRSSAPSPHWLDRNARWARPNGYGGMDYRLYDGRSCRTWREPYGALAVSCN